jgi:hypothetical protein
MPVHSGGQWDANLVLVIGCSARWTIKCQKPTGDLWTQLGELHEKIDVFAVPGWLSGLRLTWDSGWSVPKDNTSATAGSNPALGTAFLPDQHRSRPNRFRVGSKSPARRRRLPFAPTFQAGRHLHARADLPGALGDLDPDS